MTDSTPIAETEVLIVGVGPAGATSAALLSKYGIDNIVINKFAWTARTPRAHITNQRTMEVLRDLGLEQQAINLAAPRELMGENTYCTSLTGDELGRVLTWGVEPRRQADYDLASPTMMCDLPQHILEPLLLSAAGPKKTQVRADTEYLSHVQDDDGVTATVLDKITGQEYQIRAKYMIGADGAKSKVVEDIDLPLTGQMGLSGSINVVFEADLSQYVAHRPSVLYWIIQPGSSLGGLGIGVVRMVRPWNKWLCIWGYDIEQGPPEVDEAMAVDIVRKLVGDETLEIKVESTSTWTVNNVYATHLSKGRVFGMGDAIHRHPPTNGLGSNTCIQDGFNLCWKLAMVLRGQAGPSLLETYSTERAPEAEKIVTRANDSLELFNPIMQALGLVDTQDPVQMQKNIDSLKDSTPEAAQRRAALVKAMDDTNIIYNGHGVELNQRYDSTAIAPDGTPDPGFERDKEMYHQASSRPGANVPHAVLTRKGHKLSTLDLCGNGEFSLLTGLGGEAWQDAANAVEEAYGIKLNVHIIGPGQAHEDPYGQFVHRRETTETGALVVRPDFIVGWRAPEISASATEDLLAAMAQILGRTDGVELHTDHVDDASLKDDWLP
jgi:2,4-dichlorophenol 6-monooxygenase